MGQGVINIDWEHVGDMLMAGATGVEAAAAIGVHENTLYGRCRTDLDMDFVAFRAEKYAKGNEALRRKQYEVAMQGEKTMLVWLGKQRLGQADKVQNEIIGQEPVRIEIIDRREHADPSDE